MSFFLLAVRKQRNRKGGDLFLHQAEEVTFPASFPVSPWGGEGSRRATVPGGGWREASSPCQLLSRPPRPSSTRAVWTQRHGPVSNETQGACDARCGHGAPGSRTRGVCSCESVLGFGWELVCLNQWFPARGTRPTGWGGGSLILKEVRAIREGVTSSAFVCIYGSRGLICRA